MNMNIILYHYYHTNIMIFVLSIRCEYGIIIGLSMDDKHYFHMINE